MLSATSVLFLAAGASIAAFGLTMQLATYDPHAEVWAARHASLRGVNLGGWLLTERWLVCPWEGPCDEGVETEPPSYRGYAACTNKIGNQEGPWHKGV